MVFLPQATVVIRIIVRRLLPPVQVAKPPLMRINISKLYKNSTINNCPVNTRKNIVNG